MDNNVEIAKLQNEITKYLGLDPNHVVYNYADKDNIIKLSLVTINPKHEQSFLYHSSKGIDKVDALKKMMEYVLQHRKTENSYTLQWIKDGDSELHTSYFRGNNLYEVLDKFYYGRDIASYKVFSVYLNPVS